MAQRGRRIEDSRQHLIVPGGRHAEFSADRGGLRAGAGAPEALEVEHPEFGGTEAGDAAIIACAQKNEHYEIANYGTAATWADTLGYPEAAALLKQTLAEEEATDKALSQLARSGVNQEGVQSMTGQGSSSGGSASVPA